jgi:hypothetical protein
MVSKFFFGIISDVNADIIQQMFVCISGEVFPDIFKLSLCHCAYEGRSNLVICDQLTQYLVTHSHVSRIKLINFGHPVIFAMSNIQESVTMEIRFRNCGLRENQIKHFVNVLADAGGKLQIADLNLSGNRLTISGLHALKGAEGGDLFAKLQHLDLSGSLTSVADTNAAWLTTFAEALSAHCPYLLSLNLSDNNLGVAGVSALSRVFVTDIPLVPVMNQVFIYAD